MSRYSGYSICNETIASIQHSHTVWNYFYKSIIYKLQQLPTRLWYSNKNRTIYKPNKNYISSYISLHKHTIRIQWEYHPIHQIRHNSYIAATICVKIFVLQHNPRHVWSTQRKIDKQHEELKKIVNLLVNLTSETLCLSEDTKVLKETTNKF